MVRFQLLLIRTTVGCLALAGVCSIGLARTWSDASGKYKIDAELVSVDDDQVTLKKADGKLVHLPVDKLSPADQEFLGKKTGAKSTSTAPDSDAPSPAASASSSTNRPGATSTDAPATKLVDVKQDAKQIAANEQTVNDLYKAELAGAKTPQQKSEVARKMVQTADAETTSEVKFVLARKGAELAASAGSTQVTFAGMAIVEATCTDPLPIWMDCLETLLARNADDLAPPSEKIEALIPDALAKDNFAVATKLAAMLSTLARLNKDPGQVTAAKLKAAEVTVSKDEFRKFTAAQEQLKANPADSAAKAVAGRFLCLVRRDWEHGLPLLKDSNDKVLQPIAAAELKATKSAADLAALGDSWTAAVRKLPLHMAAQDRGIYWYQQALPLATGLAKIKLEKELAGHESKVGVDLISKFDPAKDIVYGPWAVAGHTITCLKLAGICKIQIPVALDMNHYQLLIEYTNLGRNGSLHLTFPVGNRATTLVLDVTRGGDGLEVVQNMNSTTPGNPTMFRPSTMVLNQRTAVLIEVVVKDDNAEIQIQSNGRKTVSYRGPINQLGVFSSWGPSRPGFVGIAEADGLFVFHNLRLAMFKAPSSVDDAKQ